MADRDKQSTRQPLAGTRTATVTQADRDAGRARASALSQRKEAKAAKSLKQVRSDNRAMSL